MATPELTSDADDNQDWGRETDLGPEPSHDELVRFFTASPYPGRYDREIQGYLAAENQAAAARGWTGEDLPLLRRYYASIRAQPERYDKFRVMDLVASAPHVAEQLFPVFRAHPLLMEPYTRLASYFTDHPNEDRAIPWTRIRTTLDPEQVEKWLRANATIAQTIVTKFHVPTPAQSDYSAGAYEKFLIGCYGDQVNLWGGVIQSQGSDWLSLRVSPLEHKGTFDSDFETYRLMINLVEGITQSAERTTTGADTGYLLLRNEVRGMDEKRLLTLLTEQENTPAEWDYWIEPYLEKQGLFDPKRD